MTWVQGKSVGLDAEDSSDREAADAAQRFATPQGAADIHVTRPNKDSTEVDLLLLRSDLLLVVEVKALIGSGMSPYDHWKNRIVIEKGRRQALLAAEHLSKNRSILASVTNKQTANGIRHIQPIVLTNESMFDGWEHVGEPVIGETIRHAITEGTRVGYFNGSTLEVLRVDHHLRVEDLSNETILAALRAPIDLKIAPEQGAVRHIWKGLRVCRWGSQMLRWVSQK